MRRGPARAVREDGGVRGQHHAALLAPEQRPGRPAVDIDVCLSLSFYLFGLTSVKAFEKAGKTHDKQTILLVNY